MTLAPLVVLTVIFGLFPGLLLDLCQAPVDELHRRARRERPGRLAALALTAMDDRPALLALVPLVAVIARWPSLVVIVDMIRPGRDDRLASAASALIGLTRRHRPMVVGVGCGTDPAVFGGAYVRDPLTALLDLIFIVDRRC